ncbi:MAG: cellulose biosynthesis cyclic di-GMP-binding regulatory protein BcsB [Pseudacidovorax sp.]|nr:cellulose biosynthesis cyclic di-GMP-binding regulatory protein BcsB [Pseudacidovorax sp.]
MRLPHRLLHPLPLVLGIGLLAPVAALASPAGDALQRLQGETWVTRSFTLADLGITRTVLLTGFDAKQEFYLPVPRNVAIADAGIDFRGRYYKPEEARTSMTLAVNGRPSYATRVDTAEGDASQVLKVDTRTIVDGFLRLGVSWINNSPERICAYERPSGNVLAVEPDTRFTYRFTSGALTNLADAWVALPARPTMIVAGKRLSKGAYDSAWRIGLAMEQAGRQINVRSFPAVGDSVDTQGWQIPPALAGLPAFSGLAAGEARHQIRDAAEVGALMVLGSGAATGDLLVMDATLRQQMNAALDELATQLNADADAARALSDWRGRQTALAADGMPSHIVRLATLGARPVIVLAEDAGAQAAGAFADAWRNVLIGRNAVIDKADQAEATSRTVIHPTQWGGTNPNFDVLAKGDWTVTMPLAALSADGRLPTDIGVDLAVSPSAGRSRPVATVYWNDTLLGARQLNADGHPERIDARVPSYVLGLNNVLRVAIQRQPYYDGCNEAPQAYPVQVLRTTALRTGDAAPDGTFVGLLPLMAYHPQVAVPESYLADAIATLPRVVRIAAASGVSPVRAELVVQGQGAFSPARPFLALQVPVDGANARVSVKDGHLRINGKQSPWLDVGGLAQASAIEVASSHGQYGLVYQVLGTQPALGKPFVLNRGDLAVLGDEGPVAWSDGSAAANSDAAPEGSGFLAEWRRHLSWGVPVIAFALLALLLLFVIAHRLKRRHDRNK